MRQKICQRIPHRTLVQKRGHVAEQIKSGTIRKEQISGRLLGLRWNLENETRRWLRLDHTLVPRAPVVEMAAALLVVRRSTNILFSIAKSTAKNDGTTCYSVDVRASLLAR